MSQHQQSSGSSGLQSAVVCAGLSAWQVRATEEVWAPAMAHPETSRERLETIRLISGTGGERGETSFERPVVRGERGESREQRPVVRYQT